ncbi:cactin-like [Leptopilina boulardi]|uniref:cactin-like n=1 Tax=Leptopilina boulardi TaxID=63433 RepID=UPI0021F5AB26|nr:cactin-like [Leptopilina boulardi]
MGRDRKKSKKSKKSRKRKRDKKLERIFEELQHLRNRRNERSPSRSSNTRRSNDNVDGEQNPRGLSRHSRDRSRSISINRGTQNELYKKPKDNRIDGERDPRGTSRHSRRRRRSPSSSPSSSSSSTSRSSSSDSSSSGSSSNASTDPVKASRKRRRLRSRERTNSPEHLRQQPEIENPTIDAETLNLLGSVNENIKFGPELNKKLVDVWENILKAGLSKDIRKELIEKYPTAINCKILQSPKLNPEIKSVIGQLSLKKDSFQVLNQNQLSAGVIALGTCLSELLSKPQAEINVSQLIVLLADAGRILTDLHHRISLTRRSFITPGLNQLVKNVAEDCDVDTLLYGEKFTEKLSAAKSAEKSGKDIAKPSTKTPIEKKRVYPKEAYPRPLNYRGPPKRSFKETRQGGHQKEQRNRLYEKPRR